MMRNKPRLTRDEWKASRAAAAAANASLDRVIELDAFDESANIAASTKLLEALRREHSNAA